VQPFVGRQPQLEELRARLAQARAGVPQLVAVRGPAGIGKTALLNRFLDEVRTEPATVIRASSEEAEVLLAGGVLEQLARSVGPSGAGLLPPTPPGSRVDDAVAAGTRLLDLFGALEDAGPLVLVVDDLHWADLPSLRALAFALRRLVADHVLALLALREEAVPGLPDGLRRILDTGGLIRLRGLDEDDLTELAGAMGMSGLSRAHAQRLREGTQGNPLHAQAILEETTPAEWGPEDRPLPSPRSLRFVVQRRYEGIGADARRLVDAAAVLGSRSALPVAAALGNVAEPLPALSEATACHLLVAGTSRLPWTLSFPHPLVRSAVYDALDPARRSALHTSAATLADDEPTALRHRIAAAPAPDAVLSEDLARFARQEATRQAWSSAVAHLVAASRASLDRDAGRRLLLEAVAWMLQTGDAASAQSFADEVRGFPATALRDSVLGSLAMARGEPAAAETLLRSAWDQAQAGTDPAIDPEAAAGIALQYAIHRYGRLDAAGSARWCRRALERTGPDTAVHQGAQTYLAHSLGYSGDVDEAYAATEGADGRDSDEAFAWLQPRSARGMLRLVDDDLDGARADLSAVATAAYRLGVLNTAAFAYATLARADYLAGAWDDAVLHAGRAVAINDESEYSFTRFMVAGIAALVPAARGEWAAAEAFLDGPGVLGPGDYERSIVAVATSRARLAETRGDPTGVLAALAPVRDLIYQDAIEEPGFWPWVDMYAEALVALGDVAEADALLVPNEERAARRGRRSSVARLARARGRVAAAAGRREEAESAFDRSLTAIGQLSRPFEQAKGRLAAGQFLRRAGQRRRAAELLEAAHRAFSALGAQPWALRCATELAGSGLQPVPRSAASRPRLTSQELVVARLAAAGRTNREIAGELVVSVKTVEYHLHNAFQKLRITRRSELAPRLAEPAGQA